MDSTRDMYLDRINPPLWIQRKGAKMQRTQRKPGRRKCRGNIQIILSTYLQGGALEFDGNGDYLQTLLFDELQIADNFTLSPWFQTNDTQADEHHIMWIGNLGGNGWGSQSELHLSVRHFAHANKLSFYFGSGGELDGTSINIVTLKNFTDTSDWHHIVGVIEDAGGPVVKGRTCLHGKLVEPWVKGFVNANGAQFPTTDVSDTPERRTWDTPLRIGVAGPTDQRFFDGRIDDVRVYGRALAPNEILAVEASDKLTTT